MEVIKKLIDNENIMKITLGTDYDKETEEVTGTVELDIENQSNFMDIINSIFDQNIFQLIVNMENISYIDSSGLWALFEGHKKATQKNGNMVLLNPTKDVQRVLNITKMSSKMLIFENESEAIKCLKDN
ncbi:hypothetical protein DID75_04150 [Candidatus Marinamargulisbacteria bacterium SCGC AG-410-N11]|nr:hypothetical protein DID75_04150 [Candidatus Marinamargulisbacteria bacterium SCGC AG-410-N11]